MWEKEMSVAPMTFQNRAFKVVALTYNGIDSLREWKLSKQESFVTKVIDLLTKRGDKYYLQMVMLTKRTCKFKTEFTRGPGRGDTCHLSFLDETLPD